MPTLAATKAEETLIHVLWLNAGLSCDGDFVSLAAASQPSIEEIALGALRALPQVAAHWPLIDFECGPNRNADDFLEWFFKADRGELEPFVLEGSIPNERLRDEDCWSGFGNDPATGQPLTTSEWLDLLAPKATAIVAAGTCVTDGGIYAMAGNPTGAMGVPDYLGWKWKSKAGIPIVCVHGCPVQPRERWASTVRPFLWMQCSTLVQGLTKTTEVDLWRDLVAQSFPVSGWLRLDHQTLAMLTAYRAARESATSDEAANDLLALAGGMAR